MNYSNELSDTAAGGFFLQGDYLWIEPLSRREFDVAIGARVVSAEGRRIQVFNLVWEAHLDLYPL
jgi:hypothetical protein